MKIDLRTLEELAAWLFWQAQGSQGHAPVISFDPAPGSYSTTPQDIDESFKKLRNDLAKFLGDNVRRMADQNGPNEVVFFNIPDFNASAGIPLGRLDEARSFAIARFGDFLNRQVEDGNGAFPGLDLDPLVAYLQGEDIEFETASEAQHASWFLDKALKLAAVVALDALLHKPPLPPCKCGREYWPITYRNPSKPGRPRLCDSMCPPCQVAHERSVDRERQARNRALSGNPGKKRIRGRNKRRHAKSTATNGT